MQCSAEGCSTGSLGFVRLVGDIKQKKKKQKKTEQKMSERVSGLSSPRLDDGDNECISDTARTYNYIPICVRCVRVCVVWCYAKRRNVGKCVSGVVEHYVTWVTSSIHSLWAFLGLGRGYNFASQICVCV